MAAITSTTASQNDLFTNAAAPQATASASQTDGTSSLANESTFLTLLVSQLKNQNPASPMDGTTFVTQLAQFSSLEQNLAMRNDLDSINSKYTATSASSTPPSSSN